MVEPEARTAYDDEIDLRALVEVLLRRKYLVLGITLLAMVAAAILSMFVLSPVFESELRLFLPNVDRQLAMSPEQYARYAVSEPVLGPVRDAIAPDVPMQTFVERFSVRLDAGNTILEVNASATSTEESHGLTSLWFASFTAKVQEYIRGRLDQAIAEADANVASMHDGLAALGDALGLDRSQRDLALEIASAAAYGQEYGDALQERSRLMELKESLASRVQPEVLVGPTLPTAPSSPRTVLNVVIAAIVGGMFGVFLAFGLEWWHGTGSAETKKSTA